MRIYDLIAKKRNGGTHSREELEAIVIGFVRGEVADYQMAAWMMAVYLCGRRRRVPQRPCLWRREARGRPPSFTPLLPRTVWSGTEDGCACVKT